MQSAEVGNLNPHDVLSGLGSTGKGGPLFPRTFYHAVDVAIGAVSALRRNRVRGDRGGD